MRTLLISILFYLVSGITVAQGASSYYQVDVIVFLHNQGAFANQAPGEDAALYLFDNNAIPMPIGVSPSKSAYHLRPTSTSQLQQAYYALNHRPEYSVLLHYTWLQPKKSQATLLLPSATRNGWHLEGTMRIQASNYYLFNTELRISNSNNPTDTFLFPQKERLKGNTAYYLDNPRAGMLIKIHPLA